MSEFVEYLHEVFELLGPVNARRMFGGYGVYHDDRMFAIVFDESLYLRADGGNRAYFEKAGLARFEYRKGGKRLKLSYYAAPADILDNREQAAIWARRSLEA